MQTVKQRDGRKEVAAAGQWDYRRSLQAALS
jgi:hypothetical protein